MSAIIMMATYNGELYVKQQIESILNQTYQDWKLLIRDDGSSDKTVNIIKQFEAKDKRITLVMNNTDKHGAYLNFWTLIHEVRLKYSDYDFYFFADQDDIWERNKIDIMIKAAQKENPSMPLLLYADMRVVDQYNKVIYDSLNSVMGIGSMRGYSLFFTHGFLWGCDICVNNLLFNKMPLLPLTDPNIDIMSHDNYMGKYAILEGKIHYINKILINHRRHNDNTTGGYSMKLGIISVLKKALFHMSDLAMVHARVYNQTIIFLKIIRKTNNNMLCQINNMENAIRSGGIRMVKLMYSMNVGRKQKSRTAGIYIIALTGKYKKYLLKHGS